MRAPPPVVAQILRKLLVLVRLWRAFWPGVVRSSEASWSLCVKLFGVGRYSFRGRIRVLEPLLAEVHLVAL